ncbi:hypothetical protein GEV43_00675 [Actinomadura sp. J1-007]|nr:hypothetical protein [Actinomadura sp. J1-007]
MSRSGPDTSPSETAHAYGADPWSRTYRKYPCPSVSRTRIPATGSPTADGPSATSESSQAYPRKPRNPKAASATRTSGSAYQPARGRSGAAPGRPCPAGPGPGPGPYGGGAP